MTQNICSRPPGNGRWRTKSINIHQLPYFLELAGIIGKNCSNFWKCPKRALEWPQNRKTFFKVHLCEPIEHISQLKLWGPQKHPNHAPIFLKLGKHFTDIKTCWFFRVFLKFLHNKKHFSCKNTCKIWITKSCEVFLKNLAFYI